MNSRNYRLNIASYWRPIPLFGFVGALLLVASDADANWRVSPELGAGIGYDDNVFLNDVSGLSASDTGYAIAAQADFIYDTELTDFTITPGLMSTMYRDDSDLDSDKQFLKFELKHDRQKLNFRFRGDYSSEAVRTAERSEVDFDIDDPEEISVDETGRVFTTGTRDRLVLAPEFSHDLSQRTSLRVVGYYQDTSYDDVSQLLNGFATYNIGATLSYRWSERDTVSFNAKAGNYEADGFSSDAAGNAFGIGYNRELSERTEFRMFVGSNTSEDQNGIDQSNPVGELAIIHRYVTTRVLASYQRRVSGTGASVLSVRDIVNLSVSRDFSPKLTLGGGVRAYSTDALDSSNTSFIENDYLQIRALVRWNVSRTVSVDFDYRYTEIDRDVPGTTAVNGDSNQIGLWVSWHPKRLPK